MATPYHHVFYPTVGFASEIYNYLPVVYIYLMHLIIGSVGLGKYSCTLQERVEVLVPVLQEPRTRVASILIV